MHHPTRTYFEEFQAEAAERGYDIEHLERPDTHSTLRRLIKRTFRQTLETPEKLHPVRALQHDILRRTVHVAQRVEVNGQSHYDCCAAAEVRLLKHIETMGNFDYAQPIVVTQPDSSKPVGVIKRLGDTTMYGLETTHHPNLGVIQPRVFYDVGDIAARVNTHPSAIPIIALGKLTCAQILRPSTFIVPQSIRRDLTPELLEDDPALDTTASLQATHKDIVKRVGYAVRNSDHFSPYI